VIRVDYARWGQTPEGLRSLALSAPHARTRERALALFEITQGRCATRRMTVFSDTALGIGAELR
jgi:hypothetical protein